MALFTRNSGVRELKDAFGSVLSEVDRVTTEHERLEEAVNGTGLAALRAEDKGWGLISGGVLDTDEIDLRVLRAHAADARALRAMKPRVKRCIVVRNGNVWAGHMTYADW